MMKNLGYTFHEPPRTWQTKLAPCSRRVLAIMERSLFMSALNYLETSIPHLIAAYPWTGRPIVL
jgi:hypothetical protein